MNLQRPALAFAILGLGLGAAAAFADATSDPPSAKTAASAAPGATAADGSAAFFSGRDLSGWQGAPGVWKVENGAIAGSRPTDQTGPTFLFSQRPYGDFDLRFQVSIVGKGGDCGLQFRSKVADPAAFRVAGYQCVLSGGAENKNGRPGSVVIEPRGTVERAVPAKLERFLKPTDNHFRIRCQGNHVLIEVNGIKVANNDFPSLPRDGVIAWKLGVAGLEKLTIKNLKFIDLSGTAAKNQDMSQTHDAAVLRAELKYSDAVNKANDELFKRFDAEIKKLQGSAKDRDLVGIVDAEKEAFKEKGLIPWSSPMRRGVKKYGTDLREAREAVGKVFDRAIERAEKSRNDALKAALTEEAGQVLAPYPVATWQATRATERVKRIKDNRTRAAKSHRIILFSDATYVDEDHDDDQPRYWALVSDDTLVLEFPDKTHAGNVSQQEFRIARDGKTLTTYSAKNREETWQLVVE
jgi:hypothetical protein